MIQKKITNFAHFTTIVNIACTVMTTIVAVITINYAHKTLALEGANLVTSETDVQVYSDTNNIYFTPKIKNIGNSSAANIDYKVYVIEFSTDPTVIKMEDDSFQRLEPTQELHLSTLIPNPTKTPQTSVVLIQYSYINTLTKKKENRFYPFKIENVKSESRFKLIPFYGSDMKLLKTTMLPKLMKENPINETLIHYLKN